MYVSLILNLQRQVFLFQYVIYDHNDFIADAGGYLGLLIGHSMFSIYVMAEEWMRRRLK